MVVAAALRFTTLAQQSFWIDEAATAHLMRLPFGDMLSRLHTSESTPPLYYSLAWGWTRIFGLTEWGLRSLSALAGTAAVVFTFAGVRVLSTTRAALATALLVCVDPLLVWYSQEARAYALLVLLAAASLWLWARAAESPTRARLLAWALVAALALATHYFAVFLMVPEALLLLYRTCGTARRRAVEAVGLVLLVGLALLPLAISQANGPQNDAPFGSPLSGRLTQAVKGYAVGLAGVPHGNALATGLILLVAIPSVWILASRGTDTERRSGMLFAYLAVVGVGIPLLLAAIGLDFIALRNLIVGALLLLLLVGVGYGSEQAGRLGVGLGGVLAVLLLAVTLAVPLVPRLQRADWRDARRYLGDPSQERAIIVTSADNSLPVTFYLSKTRVLKHRARVSELDLVGWRSPRRTPRQIGQFKPFDRRDFQKLTVIRFRSDAPVAVTARGLARHSLDGERPALLVQAP